MTPLYHTLPQRTNNRRTPAPAKIRRILNLCVTPDHGFQTDDLRIGIMENASNLASAVPADFLKKFILPDIDYQPKTLYAYEMLVVEDQVCDKAYFDAALDDICSRVLSIPDEYIDGLLCALGTQYPDALVTHFKRYIGEIRKFCQK